MDPIHDTRMMARAVQLARRGQYRAMPKHLAPFINDVTISIMGNSTEKLDAEQEFFTLSRAEPDRKIYQIYLDRIIRFRKNPPPENWDGSISFSRK